MSYTQEMTHYAKEMIAAINDFAQKFWVPATSSNFSCHLPKSGQIMITQSGRDKGHLKTEDFMIIDESGNSLHPLEARPSAETLLHTIMYKRGHIGAVFHTHSINSTYFSRAHKTDKWIVEGLEIIKAFSGNKTHESRLVFPIFPNTQDMVTLSGQVEKHLNENPKTHGYLIAGHGLYTWGETIFDAKRHIEAMEFLLALELIGKQNGTD